MTAEQERDAAKTARTTAEQERDAAKTAQTTAEQERDAAKTAQTTAEQERDAAKTARTTAEQERDAAKTAQTTAEQERDAAKTAQTTAEQERDAAKTARTTAEQERDAAKTARTTAEQERDAIRAQVETAKQVFVANAIGKVAAPGPPHRCALDTGCGPYYSGTDYSSVSITHDWGDKKQGARLHYAIPWHGEDGQVEFAFEVSPTQLQRDPFPVWTWTGLRTPQRNDDIDGITTSYNPIEEHGLGSGWQGFEAVRAYDGAGTLTIRFFTDLEDSNNLAPPYTWELITPEDEILLNDARVPELPTGRDGLYFPISEDGLKGTLNGAAGTFTCPENYCSLTTSWEGPGYVPWVDSAPVLFTPDGTGRPRFVNSTSVLFPSAEVPKVNYLSLGSWLFVPESIADFGAFRSGIFAGGDDAFVGANLIGLAGTARYAGKATGMYAETVVPDIDTFSADVELMADFGSGSENGMISGSVSNFELGSGKPSPLSELLLVADSFGDGLGNISPGWGWPEDNEASISGGFIGGPAHSHDGWRGGWDAKFYGNDDADPTAHPTSFAGAFGATDGERHIAGSFGAHKQVAAKLAR